MFREAPIPREELLSFTPCKLFERIRGRRLWFFGDSQQDALRRATTFFLRKHAVVPLDIRGTLLNFSGVPEILTDGVKPHIYPPRCVALIDDTEICGITLMDGDRWRLPFVFEFLNHIFPKFASDVVIFNYGLHYEWFKSNLPRDLASFAVYRAAVKQSGAWVMPLTVWIDTLPQHFSTHTGEYKRASGLENDTCRDIVSTAPGDFMGPYNALSAQLIANISDLHLSVWNQTRPLHYGHYRAGDCSHYCRPGPHELNIYQMYRLFSEPEFARWQRSTPSV